MIAWSRRRAAALAPTASLIHPRLAMNSLSSRDYESQSVRLAALSLATDLAMAFPPETALRTCLLGVRIGQELGLSQEQLADIFYVTLLRHLGCTAFSHEEGVVVDDDNAWRRDFTGVDYGRPVALTGMVLIRFGASRGPIGRVRAFSDAARLRLGMSTIALAHCDASRRLISWA